MHISQLATASDLKSLEVKILLLSSHQGGDSEKRIRRLPKSSKGMLITREADKRKLCKELKK